MSRTEKRVEKKKEKDRRHPVNEISLFFLFVLCAAVVNSFTQPHSKKQDQFAVRKAD